MPNRLGIHIGGTFTTLLLIAESSDQSYLIKTPSTTDDKTIGIANGLQQLVAKAGASLPSISSIHYATNVLPPVILTDKGPKVGLLVTENFEQILHLARSRTPAPPTGWMTLNTSAPPADLEYTRGIKERIAADGEVLTGLDATKAREMIKELLAVPVESIAISLLHAYANPEHEKLLQALIKELDADMPVLCSCDSLAEAGEYERTLATVMSAYAQPGMIEHLRRVEQKLNAHQLSAPIKIARGDGGLMSVQHTSQSPLNAVLSGAASSAGGAAFIARLAGYPDALNFQMGGTATGIALLRQGKATLSRSTPLGAYTLNIPSVKVQNAGAGSRAIARVSASGALSVGPPESGAASDPAGYGYGFSDEYAHGVRHATLADANIVLGRLAPKLLGGTISLDAETAREAVTVIGQALGMDVYQAAQAILDIAHENALGALRLLSAQNGLQARDLALVASGGTGPLHANAIADLAGCYPVIIPPAPGGVSALGLLCSSIRNEFTQTYIHTIDGGGAAASGAEQMLEILSRLGDKIQKWLAAEGIKEQQQTIEYEIDMRYCGQEHELTLSVDPASLQQNGLADILERFRAACARRYNFKLDALPQTVTLRAIGLGSDAEKEITLPRQNRGDADPARAMSGQRPVYFDGRPVNTSVYNRSLLSAGNLINGPAIIEQDDATTLILPDHSGEVDAYGSILIRTGFNGE